MMVMCDDFTRHLCDEKLGYPVIMKQIGQGHREQTIQFKVQL